MANQKRSKATPVAANKPRGSKPKKRSSGLKSLLPWGTGLAAALAIVAFVYFGSGSSTESDPVVAALAQENAGGGAVRILTGSHHTVYHSTERLPTTSNPRSDGKATLVWFSGTWCEYCEQMEPYAHHTASEFTEAFVFVEKSIDDDRDAAGRFGVRGTPTFVLIDAGGRELTRFGFRRSEEDFRSVLQQIADQLRATSAG
ncbi:MAG: thioredoxin family protein [Dehalococcoidia bacterium]